MRVNIAFYYFYLWPYVATLFFFFNNLIPNLNMEVQFILKCHLCCSRAVIAGTNHNTATTRKGRVAQRNQSEQLYGP